MKHTYTFNWDGHYLELGRDPLIMGIVNVTPDSFSDGGCFFSTQTAVAHGKKLVSQGAHILDIGGESTRPFSNPVSESEQIKRVVPVIEELSKKVTVPISIDTTKAAVAKAALHAGASIINDISALRDDEKLGELAANTGAPLILMHMQGMPKNMQINPVYQNLFDDITTFFKYAINRAKNLGVLSSQIIIDPGIGFGKNIEHNLSLIAHLDYFHQLKFPILVGHSRKAFIRKTIQSQNENEPSPDDLQVEIGTQAAIAVLAQKGAHIIRVHNVANTVTTLKLIKALKKSATPEK
ncbi:MAG: dihydropteroate synthase [Desulfobacteraceae bacterium]|jgi:dihydropteroate synthase